MSDTDSPHIGETLVSKSERYCPRCDQSYPTSMERCPTDGTALVELADEVDSLIGHEIDGRFTVKRRIGKGGMGAAYAAIQHSIGREVAIKVIHPHLARDKTGAKRFLRETKLAARLSHPNTVTVLDFGQTDGDGPDGRRLYMAMELVDGVTLSSVIRDGGPMDISRAIEIGVQICDALNAAHRLDIVHRDLKPSNIMLEGGHGKGDHVKVLDFGLAKSLAGDDSTVTESNAIIGTPQYISPELVTGAPADTRSDLYSLGAVLYELVTARPPFVADSVQACLFSQVHDAPPPLPERVPSALADIILQLLAKRPEMRFQTAAEVRTALVGVSSQRSPDRSVAYAPTLPSGIDARTPAAPDERSADKRSADKRSATKPLVLGAVVLAAAAATLAFMLTRGEGDETARGEQNAAQDAGPNQVAPPLVAADAEVIAMPDANAAARRVTITLESKPRSLARGPNGFECKTPCELVVDPSAGPFRLKFSRNGYRTVSELIAAEKDTTVRAELPRRKKKPPKTDDGFVRGYDDE